MKKLIKYIFIPVLAILLMSHNVSAVDMSPNVHPIWANANPLCSFYIPATDVWQNNAFSNNTTNQTYSVSKINCDYPQGLNTVKTYAVYSFRLDNFAYDNSADSGWLASKIASVSGSADWGVIGQTVSAMGSTGWQLDLYLYSTKASNGGTFQIYNPLYVNEIMYLKPNERIYFVGASYWQVTTDSDFEYNYTDLLTAINSKLQRIQDDGIDNVQLIIAIRNGVNGISQKLDDLSQDTADAINNGQADATQDASDNSSTAGNSSQSSAQGATSNLLSIFAGFANVITNASATSCVINAPLNTSFSNDNFNVDLCGLDLPPAIGTLTSIIAVMVVVPFAISMFNKFIGIMESFQR